MTTTNIELRDYLMPGGRHPYSRLFSDMETALAAGHTVYVWSVAGHMMAAGHPGSARQWSDGERYYKTAKDCIDRKNGRR